MRISLWYLIVNAISFPFHILNNVWLFFNLMLTHNPSIADIFIYGLLFNLLNFIIFSLFWFKRIGERKENVINVLIYSSITICSYVFIGSLVL